MLTITERDVRDTGPGNVLTVCWRQKRAEWALAKRGIRYRSTDPDRALAAYSAMTAEEFATSNMRQDWANWRTIPRVLSGRVPNRPLRVIDLGCGPGSSTRVLAFWCPAGSHITGYEMACPFVEIARKRDYRHRSGAPARVDFSCQPVTEALRLPDGSPLPSASVDVANASGVVGHHLTEATVKPLIAELRRLTVPGALVSLDFGPTLRAPRLIRLMADAGFRPAGRVRCLPFVPSGQALFFA